MIPFNYRGVTIEAHGQTTGCSTPISHIDYRIIVDTDENYRKLALLHQKTHSTEQIFNN